MPGAKDYWNRIAEKAKKINFYLKSIERSGQKKGDLKEFWLGHERRILVQSKPPYLASMLFFRGVYENTVDGSEIPKQPPGMYSTRKIMGKNNQPQVVHDF